MEIGITIEVGTGQAVTKIISANMDANSAAWARLISAMLASAIALNEWQQAEMALQQKDVPPKSGAWLGNGWEEA